MIIILFSFKDHIKIKLNKKSIYNGKAKRVIEINKDILFSDDGLVPVEQTFDDENESTY